MGGMWLCYDQSIVLGFLYKMTYYLFLCYLFWVSEQKPHHNNLTILVLHNFQIAFTCIFSYDSYITVKKTELFSPREQPPRSLVLGYIYCLIHDDCQFFFHHSHMTVSKTFISTLLTILQIPQGQMCHALMFKLTCYSSLWLFGVECKKNYKLIILLCFNIVSKIVLLILPLGNKFRSFQDGKPFKKLPEFRIISHNSHLLI